MKSNKNVNVSVTDGGGNFCEVVSFDKKIFEQGEATNRLGDCVEIVLRS